MKFEEKIEELISRAVQVQNITKCVSELDQKVAMGLKSAEVGVEHYGIVFEKYSNYNTNDYKDTVNPQQYFFLNDIPDNIEYIIVTFNRLKKSLDKSTLIPSSKNEVTHLTKVVKTPTLIDGSFSVEFENTKIYETENLDVVSKMYNNILLKEKDLLVEKASRLRDELMSL